MNTEITGRIRFQMFLQFQALWLLCVLIQGYVSLIAAAIFFVLSCHRYRFSADRIVLLLLFALVGFLIDSLFGQTGWVLYKGQNFLHEFKAPVWLLSLWLIFSVTLPVSVAPFIHTLPRSALAGLFLAPVSYYAGIRLTESSVNSSPYILFYIAEGLFWGYVTVVLLID